MPPQIKSIFMYSDAYQNIINAFWVFMNYKCSAAHPNTSEKLEQIFLSVIWRVLASVLKCTNSNILIPFKAREWHSVTFGRILKQ